MSRHLRSSLPMAVNLLQPSISEGVRKKFKQRQQQQKRIYNKRMKPMSSLQPNDVVRYQKGSLWL